MGNLYNHKKKIHNFFQTQGKQITDWRQTRFIQIQSIYVKYSTPFICQNYETLDHTSNSNFFSSESLFPEARKILNAKINCLDSIQFHFSINNV